MHSKCFSLKQSPVGYIVHDFPLSASMRFQTEPFEMRLNCVENVHMLLCRWYPSRLQELLRYKNVSHFYRNLTIDALVSE